MALQNNPSDFVTGESDPNEFTVDSLVEVLNYADDGEVARIKAADERETVKNWEPEEDDDEDDEETEEVELPDESDEDYNPYEDPTVPSSSLAQIISVELKSGESPTLNACRDAYKQNHE